MNIRVESYAGYRGDQTPQRFFMMLMGERKIEIEQIIDRWLEPEYSYFKVQGDDGGIYILRHDALTGEWEITLFAAGTIRGWNP